MITDQDMQGIHGPQDCGPFFLDATGPFAPEQISVSWQDSHRPQDESIERIIDRFWSARMDAANREGFELYNGPLCRLIDYKVTTGSLSLTLGPTNYRDFVGTNLHNSYLRYTHSEEILSNPLGASGLVISSDDYIVLGWRGQRVAFNPGKLHTIAGCVSPSANSQPPNPTESVLNEVRQEIGLEPDTISEVCCLGMARDKQIVQPEMIYRLRSSSSVEEIRRGLAGAVDSFEHSSLDVIRNESAHIVNFLDKNIGQMTPISLAAILLHGLCRWGSGWFASTRGYLRNLI